MSESPFRQLKYFDNFDQNPLMIIIDHSNTIKARHMEGSIRYKCAKSPFSHVGTPIDLVFDYVEEYFKYIGEIEQFDCETIDLHRNDTKD